MLKEVGCRLFPGLRPLLLAGSAPTRTCKKANAGQLSKVDGTCTPESHDADSQERKDGCDAVDKDTVQYYALQYGRILWITQHYSPSEPSGSVMDHGGQLCMQDFPCLGRTCGIPPLPDFF